MAATSSARQLRWPVGHDRVAIEVEVQQVVIDGVLQEVVSFVEDDPVWRARSPPHDVQSRQHRTDVLELRIVFQARQVDDHAAVRISQRVEQRARRGRRIFSAEHADARQRVERPIVAFRIDDAQAVSVKDQPLAEQACQPRLAGVRLAHDQDVPPADRQRELAAVFGVPDEQASSGPDRDRQPPAGRDSSDEVSNRDRAVTGDDDVGCGV